MKYKLQWLEKVVRTLLMVGILLYLMKISDGIIRLCGQLEPVKKFIEPMVCQSEVTK